MCGGYFKRDVCDHQQKSIHYLVVCFYLFGDEINQVFAARAKKYITMNKEEKELE